MLGTPATIECQRYADIMLAILGARDEEDAFYRVGKLVIRAVNPEVDLATAETMAKNWHRSLPNDPSNWRDDVAQSLERVRQGWGT